MNHNNQRLSAAEALKAVEQGALIVDIRSVATRERDGLLEGALIVDGSELVSALSPSSPKQIRRAEGQALILFCSTGHGTSKCLEVLNALRVPDLFDVDGGFRALKAEGKS